MEGFTSELLKIGGTCSILFAVFLITHKAATHQLNTTITKTFETLGKMIEQNAEMVKQNALFIGLLQQINTKIDANTWCPIVRDKSGNYLNKRGE